MKRRLLEHLATTEEASIESIFTASDAERSDVKTALRRLLDEGAVAVTGDWNYTVTANDGSKIDERADISGKEVIRSEEDILDLATRLDAYPYSGGGEAARYSGSNKVARWLLGERSDLSVPGVEHRTMRCEECNWDETEYVHRTRVPRICPGCGSADTIESSPAEE